MRRGEQGQAGGVEALAFGVLLFVVGTLFVANIGVRSMPSSSPAPPPVRVPVPTLRQPCPRRPPAFRPAVQWMQPSPASDAPATSTSSATATAGAAASSYG